MAWVIWLAKINRSGSAIEITNPIKIPNITTFMILSNLAKKSPIIEPILEIERSTPDKNIDRPTMTPKDPRANFISKSLASPTKKLRTKTKTTMGKTALVFSLI